ncbi:MAG: T9SS type A sorting domain-containing protein, partial [Melioribacteraceae bacterium]|nr:T9SS type A sorting domain-containing protein [Melioribacteraceae bacterium]
TGGDFDPANIVIINDDEDSILAQKKGTINRTRQRDSYLFEAAPGQNVNIVVNATSDDLNPMLEIFDPEGFMIGANDDAIGRERNSVLSIKLPTKRFYNNRPFPNPSIFRIVVSSIDGVGNPRNYDNGKVYRRTLEGGSYELKVFTGELSTGKTPNPTVANVFPGFAIPGLTDLEMIISGYHFANGVSVAFSTNDIIVKSVNYIHSNQIRLIIDIDQNVTPGKRDIIVTNYDGKYGIGENLFEIVEGTGQVRISWDEPASVDNGDSPSNLNVEPQVLPKKRENDIQNKEGVLSYNIYRSESADAKSNGYIINSPDLLETTFIDVIPTDRDFYYQVTAVYDQGESEPSNESSILLTDFNEGANINIPQDFRLHQNYPNPFNPVTTIKYSIPKKCNVVVKVFDMLGKEVAVITNNEVSPGIYSVEFNADELATGIYFFRIQADEFVETRKMVYLK